MVYEDLTTWGINSDLTVVKNGDDSHTLTRGARTYGQLRRNLPLLNPGDSVRIRFNGAIGDNNTSHVTLMVSPYTGFADQSGGHIVINSAEVFHYDRTYTNNTGSAIGVPSIFFSFSEDDNAAGDQVIIHDMLIDISAP